MQAVRDWFGINPSDRRGQAPNVDDAVIRRLLPGARQITLILGASGSGKSSLLRQMRDGMNDGHRCIDLARMRLERDRAVVECFGSLKLESVLERLSRVGLAEAWCYLKTPDQLSDGQRWRLRLALAMHRAGPSGVIMCDEFAALLDRVTAIIVARALRRCIDSSSAMRAIIATSHDDLTAALRPDRIARCDFGQCSISA